MSYTKKVLTAKKLYQKLTEQNLSISTDTRTLRPGDVYFGIKGEQFDGNVFAKDALEKGARLVVVDNATYETDDQTILVEDTRKILSELAKIHRKKFSIPIIVIGGSNGKTTTKELVHAVLQKKYSVHTTKGNLNNDLGVPLTILAMPMETEIGIIEIGANHPQEHTDLLEVVCPTHAIITNNGADHLEGFGSLAGVRVANKEIYDWARVHSAHVFVNKELSDLVADSDGIDRTLYPAKEVVSHSTVYASLSYGGEVFSSRLFGSYNEANILAAIAIGEAFEVPVAAMIEAINYYTPTLKRSQVITSGDTQIVLDCYNANPSSMALALRDFATATSTQRRIFIIGDMLEMGTEEARVHKEILELLASLVKDVDTAICVGPRLRMYQHEYPFSFFETSENASIFFNQLDLAGSSIFLKASRGIKIEEVIKEKVPL